MSFETKLGKKMRLLAERHPEQAHQLQVAASRLDMNVAACGVNEWTRGSAVFKVARGLYCSVSGKDWEFGTNHDLDPA